MWLATVGNLDWPSQPGLSSEKQKAELLADFDLFQSLGLNAVIFQVRPCCDAFYESQIEPWSEFLTGEQGRDPGYDPLQFAVEQAHARGLELHAWINPFRARFSQRLSPPAPHHISVTHPHLVKDYGPWQWLDPGETQSRKRAFAIVRDILRRYDVDGLHIDDYFYPYKVDGRDFPDVASWARYIGNRTHDDWRRGNVNQFVQTLAATINGVKPEVKFGISPFGIWRPGHPPGIVGLDAYAELYADARLWLQKGWADYCAPQLYWKIDPPQQSFPALLDWWQEQNVKDVALWPGLFTSRIFAPDSWPVEEIVRQIEICRERKTGGHIHFSARALREKNVQRALREIYGASD